MNTRSIMFLIASFVNPFPFNIADGSFYKGFERRHDISHLIFNVPGGEVRSVLRCGDLCARSSSCKAFCYSQSTALCYLSQPDDPIVQQYNGSDFECYIPISCPLTKGYAWYGARCIKGYVQNKKYHDARAICTKDGGHLYHFKALEWDVQPIVDLQNAVGNLAGNWLWMGADDLDVEGQYKWSDSSLLANDSPVWIPGESRNSFEHCVAMSPIILKMDDARCSDTIMFVCQIDI